MNAESDFLQADRILRIATPLGEDALLAERLTVEEHVSALFEITVAVRSKEPEIAPDQLLGKTVDVSVELSQQPPVRRTWNAIVTNLVAGPRASRGLRSYQLVLRPALWMLTQKSDCRIWLDKSATEVAEILCQEHGLLTPVIAGVVEPVPRQHYSVQWNETDLDYLMRRLQEDGLFFFWRHEEGAHTLHIASHPAGYLAALEDDGDVRFAAGSTDRNQINRFETTFRYIPGSHAGRDWNFTTPGTVPGAASLGLVTLPKNGGYELFEYPVQAGYGTGTRASEGIDNAEVERVSKLRMQAHEAEHARVEGAGTVRTLAPGHRFTPYDLADPDAAYQPHVILSIHHDVVDTSYESVENQPEYVNRFLALTADVPATPQRTVPQPRIDGTQVAIVAGPEGEEIHPDEYGRIKLWFPWDRRAAKDGSDTCWVRVAQNWAGAGWGGQVIPRIGMEVMVTYLDGDPDRPVVTGVVPNARQKVPYELPGNKTRTVLRTNSHKSSGFNELRFEDQAAQEEVFIRAQRDRNEKTLRHHTERIDQNWVQSVGAHKAVEVEGSHDEVVAGNMNLHVGSLNTRNAAQFATKTNWQGMPAAAEFLGARAINTLGSGMLSITTERGITETTMGMKAQNVGHSNQSFAGVSQNIAAGKAVQIESGRVVSVRADTSVSIASDGEVTVYCGASSLRMFRNGDVHLSGRKLSLNFTSDVEINSEGLVSLDANDVSQKSDTGFTIKGARVDIN
ncbi:type VI secretion system Vgr family protein [Roseobacter weihaiensis]|uniref:type VI secretion system Vgr family protein n=1 Tax=Roseobacter weihaiensis TaxID=2763262 RepID=UPI001D0BAE99|nr:type VI secretion system tip protein TssI/VgrG [Roseobacter sp. H9]